MDSHDLEIYGLARGFENGAAYRAAILDGNASLNALLLDDQALSLGELAVNAVGNTCTLGIRTWVSYTDGVTELDALSGLATIKQLAPSLEHHPILASTITSVNTNDVTIHVRFVYWKPKADANAASETDKGDFVPVPDNSTISLQRRTSAPTYHTIAEDSTTNDSGQVVLVASRADLEAVDPSLGEQLVFRVKVPDATSFDVQYQHDRPAVRYKPRLQWEGNNDTWITLDRPTTDGSIEDLEFLINYENNILGTANQPIEYYAGLPVFLQINYPVLSTSGVGAGTNFESEIKQAPKGLRVEVHSAAPSTLLGAFNTDEHGQVWGMLAYWNPGLNLPLEIVTKYELQDESILLPTIKGEVIEGGTTKSSYSSNSHYSNALEVTNKFNASLGSIRNSGSTIADLVTVQVGFIDISTVSGVSEFDSTDGRHAGMLHAFQQVRYMHQWFHYLTEGFTAGGTDASWPLNSLITTELLGYPPEDHIPYSYHPFESQIPSDNQWM